MEYAIGVLCTLMGARVRFGHDPNGVAEGQAIIHYGVPAVGSPPSLLIRCEERFWARVGSGSDPTPEGAVEWQGVVYPCWEMSGNSRESRFDESRVCPVDPVAATFFLVSRIEELRCVIVDRHGRFPADQSWMVRIGQVERALVHHYAASILEIVNVGCKVKSPNPWPQGYSHAIAFTHDIDRVKMHGSLWRDVRSGVGGLRLSGGIGAAIRRSRSFIRTRIFGERDPYDTIDSICTRHERIGIKPTWFWIATEPSVRNADYHPSDTSASTLIHHLLRQGHEIGLHGSYESFDNPEALIAEKRLLENVTNQRVNSVRQHYLRFRVDRTWDAQRGADLSIDSTLGFAECLGFRAGIAVPFHPWDFRRRRAHEIWVVPMIMMDGTAREYMRLEPGAAITKSRAILGELRRVHGAAAVLWHNSSLNDVDWRGWDVVYDSWLEVACVDTAWCETASSILSQWKCHLSVLDV